MRWDAGASAGRILNSASGTGTGAHGLQLSAIRAPEEPGRPSLGPAPASLLSSAMTRHHLQLELPGPVRPSSTARHSPSPSRGCPAGRVGRSRAAPAALGPLSPGHGTAAPGGDGPQRRS